MSDYDNMVELQQIADARERVEQRPHKNLSLAGVGTTQRCPHCNASYRIVGELSGVRRCPYCHRQRDTSEA